MFNKYWRTFTKLRLYWIARISSVRCLHLVREDWEGYIIQKPRGLSNHL
jgi:hypothetical protein